MATDTTTLVLLHPAGRMPDTFTGVVQALPAGITPKLPNLGTGTPAEQQQAAETFLDRNELRRVALAGHGTGALVAAGLAVAQPRRVSHLILSEPVLAVDEEMVSAQLRAMKLVPKFLFRRHGMDKDQALASLESARGTDLRGAVESLDIPVLVFTSTTSPLRDAASVTVPAGPAPWYEQDPHRFAAEVADFLR